MRGRTRAFRRLQALALVGVLALGGCTVHKEHHGRLVLLVVLDTVRRDSVQPCGARAPITPNLEHLSTLGTTYCEMVAPGSWTLPVHASIFTGKLPVEHGADLTPSGRPIPGVRGQFSQPLADHFTTLAEHFKKAGYQTMLVSGNPVLNPALGLAQGFDWINIAPFETGPSAFVAPRLSGMLDRAKLDESRPLFLFVNIIIAHDPYEGVPAGQKWIPETRGTIFLRSSTLKSSLIYRFYNGLLGEEREPFLKQLRTNYTWGVHLADEDLGSVLAALKSHNWLRSDSVIAVTADHGEQLGRNGALGHGFSVAPQVTHVFAVLLGPGFPRGQKVGRIVQSQDLYPTLLDIAGISTKRKNSYAFDLRKAPPDRIAVTTSEPGRTWQEDTGGKAGNDRMVAAESKSARVTWSQSGGLVSDYGGAEAIRKLSKIVSTFAARKLPVGRVAKPLPPALKKQLKALGYVN